MNHMRSLESLGLHAGGIAHDFNNLLVTILGNADLALCKTTPDSPAWSHLNLIKTAANRASELTNQLLACSMNGDFLREAVDLNEIVREMTVLLSVSVPRQVSLTFSPSTEFTVVLANKTHLNQIVMNLITNAVDAIGSEEGVITMKTGVVETLPECLGYEDHRGYAYLEIGDTGCGIPPENLSRIFDPLFTTKSDGRGLGLAVVREHVMSNRGHITVAGEPGRGATFTVYFPKTSIPSNLHVNCESVGNSNLSGTVLVIDDEPDVLETTAAMLQEAGCTVLTARSGEEGLTILARNRESVGLVILDMTMPLMNGEEAIREIRAIRSNLPIILISGYRREDVSGSSETEVYLQKPYRMNELTRAVAERIRK